MEEVNSSIENIDEVTRQIKISIPAEQINKEVEEALTRAARTTTVKGFRAGKAPRHMVEALHGTRVRVEVADRLIAASLSDVARKHEMDIVGNPQIDIQAVEPGKPLEFTARVSLFPHPEIKGYEKFHVRVPKHEPTDADIDQVIERMRRSKATLKKLEFRNTAQEGDVAG